jgi:FAD/FMN-containing dehydrogenase
VPELPLPNTTKNTAGYPLAPGMDWIDLFAGSEGTLGIVTEAELQLLPAPADVLAGIVFLISDGAAIDVVDAWRAFRAFA